MERDSAILRPANLVHMFKWFLSLLYSTASAWLRTPSPLNPPGDEAEGEAWVVTGASSGIGLALCELLASRARAASVTMLCKTDRDCILARERVAEACTRGARWASENLQALQVDLTRPDQVDAFARSFGARADPAGCSRVVLVNNAGVYPRQVRRCAESPGALEECFAANFHGHYLLTSALADALRHRAGVQPPLLAVNVSSFAHRAATAREFATWLRQNTPGADTMGAEAMVPAACYACSKLALVVMCHPALAPDGVEDFLCFDPGAVDTGITREWPGWMRGAYRHIGRAAGLLIEPRHAAQGLVRATASLPSHSGARRGAETSERGLGSGPTYCFGAAGARLPPSHLAGDARLASSLARVCAALEAC